MQTEFLAVGPDATVAQATALLLGSDHGCLMVVSSGRLVGIVTERDLLRAAADKLVD